MINITVKNLVEMGASFNNANKYALHLNETCKLFNINTNARVSAFIAQVFQESGNLSAVKENLYYSAKRLVEIWPYRFPTLEIANQYANNPEKLAEKVYSGRLGNKNIGDGGKFLGRGLIQLTGRANYLECEIYLGVELTDTPHLLESPKYAALSAGFFWNRAKLNDVADVDTVDAVVKATKIINGGTHGLLNRIELWKKAKTIFVEEQAPSPTVVEIANQVIEEEIVKVTVNVTPKPNLFNLIMGLFRRK